MLVTPKFLTKEIALEEMHRIAHFVVGAYPVKRPTMHIVMIGPSMDYDPSKYPDLPIKGCTLAEYTYGERETWARDYANIAQCKVLQLWHGRNSGGTDSIAHLLLAGDTPFWGGVARDGLAVGCSGLDSHHDRMVSGMCLDACIARAYEQRQIWLRCHPDETFAN